MSSVQYSSNVSNVVYDPLDGAGLNRTVAADKIGSNTSRFVGPTVSNFRGSNTTSADNGLEKQRSTASIYLSQVSSGLFTNFSVSNVTDLGAAYDSEISTTNNIADLIRVGDICMVYAGSVSSPSATAISTIRDFTVESISFDDPGIATGSVSGLVVLNRNVMHDFRTNVIFGYTPTLANVATTAIKSGSTAPNRNNNRTEKVRTTRTGSAIRAGYWNEFTGSWSTAPTTADDSSALSITSDNGPTASSKITYMITGKVPTRVAYNA